MVRLKGGGSWLAGIRHVYRAWGESNAAQCDRAFEDDRRRLPEIGRGETRVASRQMETTTSPSNIPEAHTAPLDPIVYVAGGRLEP